MQTTCEGKTHKQLIKGRSGKKTLSTSSSNLTVGLSPKDQVTKAEVLQALKVVEGNMSFASASGDAKRFQEMFPDSAIAKKYSQGETKTKYTIQYGIAPYFKSKLLEDFNNTPFVFKFDETTNSQIKKQYDGYIRYMSSSTNMMTTAYVGSLFVGHCNAKDLLDHFFEFIKDLNLDTDLLLGIGMDGPYVNKSFEASLIAKLEEEKGNSLIPIGSCPLHVVNNGFGAGMKRIKEVMDIEQFLIDVHFFFKLSAARREDYKEVQELTDVTAEFLLKYCSTRWLHIGHVVVRMMEQIKNVKYYFLTKLPILPGFKGKKGVANTQRYQRITKMLKNELLLPCMSFIAYASQIFKPFVLLFQNEEPLVHMLYPQMKKLVQDLLHKFVDKKVLKELESMNAILNYDVNAEVNFNVQREMGTKTNSLLTDLDNLVKKKFVDEIVTNFYTASTEYLIGNFPLEKQVIIDAQYLHPNKRQKKIVKPLLRLVSKVTKCLGDKFHDVFGVKKSCTVQDLQDIIKTEISSYQMESVPESYYMKKHETKRNSYEQPSYWRYAYRVAAGIDVEEEEEKQVFRRIDEYWMDISKITDESTGNMKYAKLCKLVFCVLLLPHENPEPERGFSINKHLLQIHGSKIEEDTIVALRMVKDHILKCKGIMNVHISQDLLNSINFAYQRYHAHLEAKEEDDKRQKEEKQRKEMEAAEAKKKSGKKEKLQKEVDQHKNDLVMLQAGIKIAEEVLEEGNDDLEKYCQGKTVDVKKVKRCQVKISMALKRKTELEAEVTQVKKKIKKLEEKDIEK